MFIFKIKILCGITHSRQKYKTIKSTKSISHQRIIFLRNVWFERILLLFNI